MRWIALLVAALVVGACTPKTKAGDVCGAQDEDTVVCADTTSALYCKAGRRMSIPCRGPSGCKTGEQRSTCDATVGMEGDACVTQTFGPIISLVCGITSANATESHAILRCEEGKLVVDQRCRGPKGCDLKKAHSAIQSKDFGCDRSVGDVGDACNTRGHLSDVYGACSADKKAELECDKDESGKLVVAHYCIGPKGCTSGGPPDWPAPLCDRTGLTQGSQCGRDDEGECSPDGTALLVCDHATATYTSHACTSRHCVHEQGMLAACNP